MEEPEVLQEIKTDCSSVESEEKSLEHPESVNEAPAGKEPVKSEVCEAPVKKKRGRKKKSEKESVPDKAPEVETETPARSGRKRKTVDYFTLANPYVLEEDEKPKRKYFKATLSEVSKKEPKQEVVGEGKQPEEFFNGEEPDRGSLGIDSILASVGLTKGDAPKPVEVSKMPTPPRMVEEQPVQSYCGDSPDNSGDDCSKVKKHKYRKTGNTVKMISTLFSQFISTPKSEVGESSQAGNQSIDILSDDGAAQKTPGSGRGRGGRGSKRFLPTKEEEAAKESLFVNHTNITCAICNKEMNKSGWTHHKQRFHNNLAWRVGEPPLDLSNQALVMQILNALYKSRKPLYCDICDLAKKSVVGFLSHKAVCGKSEKESEQLKVKCTFCNKKVFPASMPSHVKTMHETVEEAAPSRKFKEKKKQENTDGKSKRRAATNALKVIQFFKAENTLGTNSEFVKYFTDITFITSPIASTMLQKQIHAFKTVKCKYSHCMFESQKHEEIVKHVAQCSRKPNQGFVCKDCLAVKETVEDILSHIKVVHDVVIKESKSSDDESYASSGDEKLPSKSNKKKSLVSYKDKDKLKRAPTFVSARKPQNANRLFDNAYAWTMAFHEKHYSANLPQEFFMCFRLHWQLLHPKEIEVYLPKICVSCDVSNVNVRGFEDVLEMEHMFRKFELFESDLNEDGNCTLFCGGPINAMAWLPTPHNIRQVEQILAVATRNDPDTNYKNDANYAEKTVIQFWNFGQIHNVSHRGWQPQLEFCLSIDYGPVWHLEWCPSGCFDTEDPQDSGKLKRMGVLAVAGSDSFVYIYAIPFLPRGTFFRGRPILKLKASMTDESSLNKKKFHATKISWSKAKGHQYLAVGYTNGVVCMFDLFTKSKLLRRVDNNGLETLLPYKSFQAHFHSITVLVLYHLNDGCRWLLTSSYDRSVNIWDLNDVSSPISSFRKNIITDGIWLTNWLCQAFACDDASTIGHISTGLTQARNFLSEVFNILYTCATVTSLTGSDWLNGIIQADAMGEIFAVFPKQLIYAIDSIKTKKFNRFLLGYTALIEKGKTIQQRVKEEAEKQKALRNELTVKRNIKEEDLPLNKEVTHLDYNPHYFKYEPLMYHEAEKKYALSFCDCKIDSYSDFPSSLGDDLMYNSKKLAITKPNMYPLQAINKILFNPNRQACTFFVAGYQAGFVRLTCLKFLSDDPQVTQTA